MIRSLAVAALVSLSTLAGSALADPPKIELQEVADTGSMPKGVSLSPDGTRLFVTNFGMANGHNITIYDATTLAPLGAIDLPGVVVETVLSADGSTIFASNFTRDSVQLVDVKTKRVTREINVGIHPKILVLSRDGKTLYAANWNGNSVTEVDVARGAVIRTLPAGVHPRGMALAQNGTLYVANFDGATIDVFKGPDHGQTYRLAACAIPRHLALSPDEKTLYVSCYHDSQLWALDVATERFVHVVNVGKNPKSIEVSRDGRYVYSADYGPSNSVSVVDTTTWTATTYTVPGLDRGSGIAVYADGKHAAVTGWCDNHVFLVGFEGTGGHPREAQAKMLAPRPHGVCMQATP
jgi:YVTN family beta-propeller protein